MDFNLEENFIVCGIQKFETEDLEIVDVYRYEGDSDPGGEATVYGLESKSRLKGFWLQATVRHLTQKQQPS
ncbi:MAG: hypothetical protein SGJ10_01880 [Bacteroidota bacterium]|nr:hypothetical protein [Bacteroidota bacterium]